MMERGFDAPIADELRPIAQREGRMNDRPPKPVNLWGIDKYRVYATLFAQAWKLLLDSENRDRRNRNGVTTIDGVFSIAKLTLLEQILVKYRHIVKFGNQIVLDSTYPPYPSLAFDKRLSNYLNNLDMTTVPSGIVSLSTTNSCPYACPFCSTNARRDPATDLDEELVARTIETIQDLGVPFIILHGGEPFFRYDRFLRLVKHVRSDTCLWLFTTGYGVTAERARELKDNGLFGAWVSLDHYQPEVHNRMRGHAQAFDNACNAIGHFKDAGVYTCLSLVPPDEFNDPAEFKRYYDLAKELGVAEIRVMEKKPSGREACRGVKPHSPVLSRLQKDLFANPAYRSHPPISGLSTWLETDPALGCQCRFEYLFVTSTGEVQPCEATEISFGNIREEDFTTIYERARQAFTKPSTGCIPMVMFSEVRDYQKVKDSLSSPERAKLAAQIMEGFRRKGKLPGAYKAVWSMYERRLRAHRSRLKRRADAVPGRMGG